MCFGVVAVGFIEARKRPVVSTAPKLAADCTAFGSLLAWLAHNVVAARAGDDAARERIIHVK